MRTAGRDPGPAGRRRAGGARRPGRWGARRARL